MKDNTRKSIYRIIFDVIKADQIISVGEIEFVREMCERYSITPEMRESAMDMSLQEAVMDVRTMPVRQMETLLKDLKVLTLSDGSCCREEALLLLAFNMCFTGEKNAEVISVPWSDVMVDNNQVLFVENGFEKSVNDVITDSYASICNSLKVGGFDFVYIPKVVESLHSANRLLDDIVFYLAPMKSKEEALAISGSIKGFTTESLYRELLLGKLRFNLDLETPSLMFKIGFSIVNGQRMANYLIAPVSCNVVEQVNGMMSRFMGYQNTSSFLINNTANTSSSFVYSGFYRTLFDLVTYRQGATSTLMVHPYNHKNVLSITTKSVDGNVDEVLNLGPKESAFYVFLIKETIEYGGYNLSANTAADIRYLGEAQHRFEQVYFSLCNREVAPDITDSDIRRPMLSRIRKAIEQHSSLVQKMTFMPETTRSKVIKVHVGEDGMRFC